MNGLRSCHNQYVKVAAPEQRRRNRSGTAGRTMKPIECRVALGAQISKFLSEHDVPASRQWKLTTDALLKVK